ncbi:MAG: histone deacetylase [Candidatus Thermoplasmatota archaeon]|nr:histone deacetylase [Candidatus Thermoplasmatota archaeon]
MHNFNADQFLFHEPNEATRSELVIGHDPYYVDDFLNGKLSDKEIKRIGLTPWTPKLIPRTLRLMGGAIAALNHVVENGGIAGNMAGGTHHAHYDFGSGYCIFNDLAVCALMALQKHNYKRVVILDFDVHQGDGTATILQNIDGALTISLHCQENFPFRKATSDHDLELKANSNDEQFLQKVSQAIDIATEFNPQLILYQAGVDGLATDALGKLNITRKGMNERNKLVFDMAVKNSIPTVVFMGGGYSKPISHTIDAFSDLFTAAARANSRFTNTFNE